MPELEPGTVFAGHRIEGVAGRGGMGVVYRATHIALDHVVALKVISPELASDERFRERFVRESRAAVSIRHPNVVTVRHAGEEDGLLFVTMDLIDGVDLGRLLRSDGALEPARAVTIVAQIGAALDAAHERGLLHRDVKPGNVLIEERAGGERAYLTDFGLTKRIASNTGVTATGAFVGTIDYVAPEQIKGGTLDARTDVYALGCVLFETVTGDPPFADRHEQVAKLYAHLQDVPPPVSEAGPPGTPLALDAVVARALEKEPDKRFPSAGALADAATAVVAAPAATVESAPPSDVVEGEETKAVEEPAKAVEEPPPPVEAEPPAERRAPERSTAALPPPKEPRSPGALRRRRLLAGLAALIVVGIVIALVAGGGGGGSGGSSASTTTGSAGGANPKRSHVLGTPIDVPGMPVGIGVGEGGVWTSLRDKDEVVRVNPNTQRVTGTADVGSMPNGLTAKLGKIWVTNAGDGTVSPVDPNNLKVGRPITVGTDPRAIGFAAGSLWVANAGSNNVYRIEKDGTVSATIGVGAGPRGVAAGPGGVWISNGDDSTISIISPKTNTLTDTVQLPAGADPKGSAIAAGEFWVANEGNDTVTPIDLNTHVAGTAIPVGKEPRDVSVGGDNLYVSNGGSGSATEITPASASPTHKPLTDTFHLGKGSAPENASSGLGQVWVADGGTDTVVPLTPVSKKKR
jgi:YVTN family beta-propeller protein